MSPRARLTLDIDSDLHEELKVIAARHRTSMRDYCVRAIQQRIQEEDRKDYLTAEEAPLLAELWDNEKDAIYDEP